MNSPNTSMDAREIAAQSNIHQVLQSLGATANREVQGNLRMDCPIETCEASNYGQLAVKNEAPYQVYCHNCRIRGDIFHLVHIHLTRQTPPTPLRGNDFRIARDHLLSLFNTDSPTPPTPASAPEKPASKPNVPLIHSDNERVRAMATLHEKGITDVSKMPPTASKYVRERSHLTKEICERYGVFHYPHKGILQGRICYRLDDVNGEVLGYCGRDPDFEAKHTKWEQSKQGKEPLKFRYPSEEYLRKGLEFYGQQAWRLQEEWFRQSLQECGLVIVEGKNDVLNLAHEEKLAANGAMSNRLTDEQILKALDFASKVSGGKITLMFDQDAQGVSGALETAQKISQYSPLLIAECPKPQPELLSFEESQALRSSIAERWRRI